MIGTEVTKWSLGTQCISQKWHLEPVMEIAEHLLEFADIYQNYLAVWVQGIRREIYSRIHNPMHV